MARTWKAEHKAEKRMGWRGRTEQFLKAREDPPVVTVLATIVAAAFALRVINVVNYHLALVLSSEHEEGDALLDELILL